MRYELKQFIEKVNPVTLPEIVCFQWDGFKLMKMALLVSLAIKTPIGTGDALCLGITPFLSII